MSHHADTTDLRARVADVLPGLRSDLEDLVRIESVSADPARAAVCVAPSDSPVPLWMLLIKRDTWGA